MSKALPVILDFDGVIADLHREWLRLYNELYDDDLEFSEVTSWGFEGFIKEAAKPTESDPGIYGILNKPDLYDRVLPVPGALEGIDRLNTLGIPWVIATSCGYHNMIRGKVRWMERYRLSDSVQDFPADRLIIIRNKSLLAGSVMVDDYVENLRGFNGCRILFDAPYNQDSHLLRARGWDDVIELILALRDARPLVKGWAAVGCLDQL